MTWPNFLIIGAAKAGTTSLYQYLQQHPAVFMSRRKEPNFFVFEGESIEGHGPGFSSAVRSSVRTPERYEALFAQATTETAVGEASTKYLYRSARSAERIHQYRPDMKLIAVLRQPVERGYSQYLQNLKGCAEPARTFEEAVAVEPQRIAADLQDKYHYLTKGYYGRQLQHYRERFAPEQMRIYLYEDLVKAPARLLADTSAFLEIDPDFPFDTAVHHNVSRGARVPSSSWGFRLWNLMGNIYRKSGRRRRDPITAALYSRTKQMLLLFPTWTPPLTPEFRRAATERYREDAGVLSELIQRDLSHWFA